MKQVMHLSNNKFTLFTRFIHYDYIVVIAFRMDLSRANCETEDFIYFLNLSKN